MHEKLQTRRELAAPREAMSECEAVNMPALVWARWRAPLGYPIAAVCLWLAHPTFRTIVIGSCVAILGLLMRADAAGHLRKREALARTGPYARTRNPLYFGSALMAAGFALAARSWIAAVLLGTYFIVFYMQVMRREASELRRQYGQAYDEYARAVPLFWPRFRAQSPTVSTPFSLAQYLRNREYSAAIGTALLIALLSAMAAWQK